MRAIVFVLVLLWGKSYAQLEVTFPMDRVVFQRSQGNASLVWVTGHTRANVERVEAKAIPIQGGTETPWVTIESFPRFGSFRGSIVLSGGWYKLLIRAITNEIEIDRTEIAHVGVGEVFLVSGQSNAQGYDNYGQKGATDDRVNVVNNHYSFGFSKPDYPSFGKLEAQSKIAPTGNGAWCWGELGDMLAQRLNVPILFYNAAWEGFDVFQFSRSITGEAGFNVYSGNSTLSGYPFNSITNALQYYCNLTGIRSVIWHQGETDNYLSTPRNVYREKLQSVIEESRNRTGKNISWMVCRVSKTAQRFYQPIIDAQNDVINTTANVFQGPNTDLILDRTDGVHFSLSGLTRFAQELNSSMNADFFARSQPQLGNPPMTLFEFCNPQHESGNPYRLSAPQGYVRYAWSTGSNSDFVWVNTGRHQSQGFDQYGNVYWSAPYSIPSDVVPEKPEIRVLGSTAFCPGESVELEVRNDYGIYWNNNTSGSRIRVFTEGNYKATYVNRYSCWVESEPVSIRVHSVTTPQISADGPTEICSDESLNLRSDVENNLRWNNNRTEREISITTPGKYYAIATNNFGCEGKSNEIEVSIKPAAAKPEVFLLGPEEICDYEETELMAFAEDSLIWNVGANNEKLIVQEEGSYYATNINRFGCKAKSNEVFIKVNASPTKPTISTQDPLFFCDNRTILLQAPLSAKYEWNTGQTSATIETNVSGSYLVRVENEFGCISEISDPVEVKAMKTPAKPNLIQTGAFTISSFFNEDTSGLNYIWKFGTQELAKNSSQIKAKQTGTYTLQGLRNYSDPVQGSIACIGTDSEPISFYLDPNFNGYRVYPNPTVENIVKIETLEDHEKATVQIISMQGRIEKEYAIPVFDSIKSFDLSNLPKGVYLVRIKNYEIKFTTKIIKD